MSIYENLIKNDNIVKRNLLALNFNFIDGAFIEIGDVGEDSEYNVRIFDGNDLLHYETTLNKNMWARTNKKYFVEWKIKVYEHGNQLFEHIFNLKDKRVYIHLDSSSLGDTLAWFPMIDEFRKKHNCIVICSTFHNYLFEETYPEIQFVNPGSVVNDIYSKYSIGWFYTENNEMDLNRHPNNFRDQHLQKTASDILGLEFKEIKPKINFQPKERPIDKKYVCIANHSTAQSKYWNNPTGWQEIVDHLKSLDYEVVLLSKEHDGYMGNMNPIGVIKLEDKTLDEIMNYIHHSECFIGLGSGLSWLSWALNKKVFLISGFSRPNCEMQDCIRIFTPEPLSTCNGCFNDFRLDPGDWNWCPRHKNTQRMFECTKSITGKMVIDIIDKNLTNKDK